MVASNLKERAYQGIWEPGGRRVLRWLASDLKKREKLEVGRRVSGSKQASQVISRDWMGREVCKRPELC